LTHQDHQIECFEPSDWEEIHWSIISVPDHSLNTQSRVKGKTQEIHGSRGGGRVEYLKIEHQRRMKQRKVTVNGR
jgi:hypothetical protein